MVEKESFFLQLLFRKEITLVKNHEELINECACKTINQLLFLSIVINSSNKGK